MVNNIINKIGAAGLTGRGGACYPTALKWRAVKVSLVGAKKGYIVINGAEGEPGVKKDGYILDHYPQEVVNGIYLAYKYLGEKKIDKVYFFINSEYYKKYGVKIKQVLETKRFSSLEKKTEFIIKPKTLTYISGEESALLNIIEKKRTAPRLKPPFPTQRGLFTSPTLINNVETFYNVSLVSRGKYKNHRFYTINGAVRHPGVYYLPEDLTIEQVLERTNNQPSRNFFVQIGGEASGGILNSDQLQQMVTGAGSIMVYDINRTNEAKLIKYWLKFYYNQSCGNCTSCREGTYRLWELVNSKEFDQELFWELINNLEESSFCALGSSLPIPVKTYFKNILLTK